VQIVGAILAIALNCEISIQIENVSQNLGDGKRRPTKYVFSRTGFTGQKSMLNRNFADFQRKSAYLIKTNNQIY